MQEKCGSNCTFSPGENLLHMNKLSTVAIGKLQDTVESISTGNQQNGQ